MPAECGNLGCTKFDTDTVMGGPVQRHDRLLVAVGQRHDRARRIQKSGGWMEKRHASALENAVGGSGDDEISATTPPTRSPAATATTASRAQAGNDYLSGGPGADYLEGDGTTTT